jgi:hypothetical protein
MLLLVSTEQQDFRNLAPVRRQLHKLAVSPFVPSLNACRSRRAIVQLKTSTAAVYLFAGAAISAWLLPRYQPSERLAISLGPMTL